MTYARSRRTSVEGVEKSSVRTGRGCVPPRGCGRGHVARIACGRSNRGACRWIGERRSSAAFCTVGRLATVTRTRVARRPLRLRDRRSDLDVVAYWAAMQAPRTNGCNGSGTSSATPPPSSRGGGGYAGRHRCGGFEPRGPGGGRALAGTRRRPRCAPSSPAVRERTPSGRSCDDLDRISGWRAEPEPSWGGPRETVENSVFGRTRKRSCPARSITARSAHGDVAALGTDSLGLVTPSSSESAVRSSNARAPPPR